MGCCFEQKVKEDPIIKLSQLRSQIMTTIEFNKIKIEKADKDIEELNEQIKLGENDLRQNQYSYTDLEKQNKAKKLLELQKDRQRATKNRDSLSAYNETLKNNLSTIEAKIEELRKHEQIVRGNSEMEKIEAIDTVGALKKNIEHIMIEQDKQQKIIETMQIGDGAINAELGIKNEQDYLKSLLGSGGTNGGPTSY